MLVSTTQNGIIRKEVNMRMLLLLFATILTSCQPQNTDIVAPGAITNLSTVRLKQAIKLQWDNPGDIDFIGIRILKKTGSFSSSISDGSVISSGLVSTFIDTSCTTGTIYYYSLYSYDSAGNFSVPVQVSESPLDPTVTILQDGFTSYLGTQDSYIRQSNPTNNYGASTTLYFSTEASDAYNAFIKFDTASVPSTADLVEAQLTISLSNYSGAYEISIWKCLQAWDESLITWNTAPTVGYIATTTVNSSSLVMALEINMVKAWLENPTSNYGIRITKGTSSPGIAYSSEITTISSRPKLELTYF
jgi:hypothetical protein